MSRGATAEVRSWRAALRRAESLLVRMRGVWEHHTLARYGCMNSNAFRAPNYAYLHYDINACYVLSSLQAACDNILLISSGLTRNALVQARCLVLFP